MSLNKQDSVLVLCVHFHFLCIVFLSAFPARILPGRSLFADLPSRICSNVDWDRSTFQVRMVDGPVFFPKVCHIHHASNNGMGYLYLTFFSSGLFVL